MVKFGITERGDAAFSDDWIEPVRLGVVSAAVVISKGLPTPTGQKFMKENFDKIIFHATTTGYGGTIVEPNVEKAFPRLDRLKEFCDSGFPMNHVVVRVDPIIPTRKGIDRAFGVVYYAAKLGFRRFRWSYLDVYQHVADRFAAAGMNIKSELAEARAAAFKENKEPGDWWKESRSRLWDEFPGIVFESCAEVNEMDAVGCISKKDFALCGLDLNECYGYKGQRAACRCCANKTELLDGRHRCPFKCLYCYWKD